MQLNCANKEAGRQIFKKKIKNRQHQNPEKGVGQEMYKHHILG